MSRDYENNGAGILVLVGIAFLVIVFAFIAWGSWYTVAPGERVVLTRNSAIIGQAGSGLHFKWPIIDGADHISVQPQKAHYGDKDSNSADHLEAYSFDQQPASLVFSVNWHVTNVDDLYSNFRDIETIQDKIIDPKAREIVKNVFGQFEASAAIQKRLALNGEVTAALQHALKGQPVSIDSVQIEDIAFSDKYERAVEDRMEATVHQQQALADKAKRITNADAAAYEVRVQADAQAHKTEVLGSAQAGAIKARGDALRDNPNLVALTAAEKWDGQLPSTMVPGGSVPMLSLKGGQ
jgi:regulator of protease activity HflC (stomatin/prohibitin superfamily)